MVVVNEELDEGPGAGAIWDLSTDRARSALRLVHFLVIFKGEAVADKEGAPSVPKSESLATPGLP